MIGLDPGKPEGRRHQDFNNEGETMEHFHTEDKKRNDACGW